jgi:hypothetical protein
MIRERRPASLPPQDLSLFQERLLQAHNRERQAIGLPPLRWDPLLSTAAAAYGPALAARARLAHSPREARPGQGENLWMGTRGAYRLEDMTGGWIGEKSLFQPGIFPKVSKNGHRSDVAHYTQMIWAGTDRMGCALHASGGWDYLICRYAPPGNVVGRPVP